MASFVLYIAWMTSSQAIASNTETNSLSCYAPRVPAELSHIGGRLGLIGSPIAQFDASSFMITQITQNSNYNPHYLFTQTPQSLKPIENDVYVDTLLNLSEPLWKGNLSIAQSASVFQLISTTVLFAHEHIEGRDTFKWVPHKMRNCDGQDHTIQATNYAAEPKHAFTTITLPTLDYTTNNKDEHALIHVPNQATIAFPHDPVRSRVFEMIAFPCDYIGTSRSTDDGDSFEASTTHIVTSSLTQPPQTQKPVENETDTLLNSFAPVHKAVSQDAHGFNALCDDLSNDNIQVTNHVQEQKHAFESTTFTLSTTDNTMRSARINPLNLGFAFHLRSFSCTFMNTFEPQTLIPDVQPPSQSMVSIVANDRDRHETYSHSSTHQSLPIPTHEFHQGHNEGRYTFANNNIPGQQTEARMAGIQSIDEECTHTLTARIFTHPIMWILAGYFIIIASNSPDRQIQKYLTIFILMNLICCYALDVSTGWGHTCALSSQFHTVKCFGVNNYGQLGLGDNSPRGDEAGEMGDNLSTIDLGSNFDVVQIAVGAYHSCGLSQTGKVKCFGRNSYGQLGLGDMDHRGDQANEMGDKLPEVDLGTNFIATQIAAGNNHNCALSQSQTVKCWGFNSPGGLGLGDTNHRGDNANEMGNYLQEVDLGTSFQPVAMMAGWGHTCALSTNNTMKCFGSNVYGQLGYGDTNNRGDDAGEMGENLTEIDLGTNFHPEQIALGNQHTCAVHNCTVKCWGRDGVSGNLGYGDAINRGDNANEMGNNLPEVDLGSNVCITQIAARANYNCVVSSSNKVKCFGSNAYGQLGLGDTNNRGDEANEMGDNLPDVDLGSNFNPVQIALGHIHACAISSSNTVKCWGDNAYGSIGQGDTNNRGDEANEMGEHLPEIDIGMGFATRHPTHAPSNAPSNAPSAPTSAPSTAPTYPPSTSPTGIPTASPSAAPSNAPTTPPSNAPSRSPSAGPTNAPTFSPSNAPSYSPSSAPTIDPSKNPTSDPTIDPTRDPTVDPTIDPTTVPTGIPTASPSAAPSNAPSRSPSLQSYSPSSDPTSAPSLFPTFNPSRSPTNDPTAPSDDPSSSPTIYPTTSPSDHPSSPPTHYPSSPPTLATSTPSSPPTSNPSSSPTITSSSPTFNPSTNPSSSPTHNPSAMPTITTSNPSSNPSFNPSYTHSMIPSVNPSRNPTLTPTSNRSINPSLAPSRNPSTTPTIATSHPSSSPSSNPSANPSSTPSMNPAVNPSLNPTLSPTFNPSISPSDASLSPSQTPTKDPTAAPSLIPTPQPSKSPLLPGITHDPSKSPLPEGLTHSPTDDPSGSPSQSPSRFPSAPPSQSPTSTTQAPSIHPTQNPSADPTTAYPTLTTPFKRHFVMVLTGNFDEFQRYLNNTNVTKAVWAKGLVRMMINVAIYPQLANVIITIKSVRKGSVIIDYSLEIDVISLLDLAEQNINFAVEVRVNANLTMPIASITRYTLNPTTHPTAMPTTTSPSQSPTMKPTKPPLKPAETHNPTTAPTKEPSGSPTVMPTDNPTTSSPSADPTVSPTFHPTQAPTPLDIHCNQEGIATETDGAYEYYLHIDEPSIVRFDTCHTLALFDIFIVDANDTDKTYSCIECGSICHAKSQYQVTLSVGKYRMDIDGPHAFKMICIPKPDTNAPTASPITSEPTKTPTGYPTINPTTMRPTKRAHPVFNVSFPGRGGAPISRHTFLGDPYGRFEAYIEVEMYDAESVLGVTALCTECFVWQYRLQNGVWTDIAHANNDDISVYNQQMIRSVGGRTTFQSRLTIQSIRRLNAGRCVDENDNSRLFTPGNVYELRLQFVVDKEHFVSSISNALSIETNTLPSGGFCVIQDFENLDALKPYNLFCDEWDNEDNLEYNALLKDVLMSKSTFVNDARKLRSVAPVGNVSIIVMIKERNVDNAITCYPIHAAFKRIADTIHDKLNASSMVSDILDDIASITNTTSYSEKPDVAVSIVTVIEDIYAEDLTTQNEAAMMVDDIVDNILEGSGVLDIVINVQNNTDNISWVVLEGEDIITELTTISTITSNEDIVDAETTTTVLVYSYLPQIFEAIDVFVDVNTRGNKTNGTKPSAIQDQLYNIAGQSQQLIENLESTLQATLEAVTVVRDVSIINETEVAQVVENLNNLAQSLVEYATLAASKALSKSDIGETFNYETTEYNEDGTIQNKKTIIATKFDANVIDYNDSTIADEDIILPKCGNAHQNIELPLSFMKQQDGVFDCAFMASSRNNFVSKQERNQTSDTVSINIYNDDSKPNVFESNACFPYLITMELSDIDLFDDRGEMSLDSASAFPSCDFWNVSDSLWDTSGCFVYHVTKTSVTCGCTHLTTFSISQDAIVPEANILTEIDWREFTLDNLYHYPTVWLTCLLFFIVFLFICWVSPIICDKIKTRSIMAFEDIIYKSVQEEKLWKDISGKEIKYITDYMPNQHLLGRGLQTVAPTPETKRSVCRLQWKLYGAYLRNDHTLLSVFQRTAGTNFSLNQRLGCFFMYLCNIMVVTGTFYGLEQSTPVQDVLASFIISLCGTLPVLIIRKLFEKSKPLEVKSTKHVLEEGKNGKVADLDDYAGVDVESPATPEDEAGEGTLTAWNDWDMGEFMQKGDLTIREFNAQITKLYDQENKEDKIRAISDIRKALFDKMFPLPNGFKKCGWIVLILWSLAACVTAIVYGFTFDIDARAVENTENPNQALYQNSDCWNTTLALQIEADLSQQKFMNDYVEQGVKNASSYAGGDAKSWLMSIFQSLLTSLILWQPLTVYLVTWIKIWMFSWHLKMQVGPGNVILLCKRCCCGYDHPLDEEEDTNPTGQKSKLKMLRDVVANKNRPVDIISFLGNEEWIIDDTTNVKEPAIKEIHEASDSASLSVQNVDSDQEGQGVELHAITQIKTVSASDAVLPQTTAGKGTNDEVKEEVVSDEEDVYA